MENGWEFFLQAHESLKKTARPTHYVVLRNGFENMRAEILETIVSFDLTSLLIDPPARPC